MFVSTVKGVSEEQCLANEQINMPSVLGERLGKVYSFQIVIFNDSLSMGGNDVSLIVC